VGYSINTRFDAIGMMEEWNTGMMEYFDLGF
jgi:hypothetical protein